MTSTTVNQITKALEKLFQKHRVVFWYDDKQELRRDFDAVEIDGVEKVVIDNDEFGLKYRMLREEPNQNFLVFRNGPEPELVENHWLIDVQLANCVFSTDQATIWLTELGLPYDLKPVVQKHPVFFNAARRRELLKKRIDVKQTPTHFDLRRKMLAVCANCPGTDSRLDTVLECLLAELATDSDKNEMYDLICKCQLDEFLFEQMKRDYSYESSDPGIRDFMIELFKSCYALGTDGEVRLSSEALVFLKRWKDNRNHEEEFETLSKECEKILKIQNDLESRDSNDLIDIDYFRIIELKILSDLIQAVLGRTQSANTCKSITRSRRTSHWYSQFQDIYEAVDIAAEFIESIDTLNINLTSLQQGIETYVKSLYRIDLLYRKFIYHSQKAEQPSFFEELGTQICNMYTNSYLLPLGDRWQGLVDQNKTWEFDNQVPQRQFFKRFVQKFIDKKKKVFVIISDAMRYEIGTELSAMIRQENRFEAKVSHMLTGLPSYTQLGMASLLPNRELEIQADGTTTVNVDGESSSGRANRERVLNSGTPDDVRTCVLNADEFLSFKGAKHKEIVKGHDLVYIFHNRIDKVGHTRDTEKRVFSATEEALEEVVKMVSRLSNANASNILITADHGFIYQDEVEESDYSTADINSEETFNHDRRFIIGRDLKESDGANRYSSEEIGLTGELEVLIPKSINRFRKRGSATRFVHGGCTLQETVVPVLQVKKSKSAGIRSVDVELLPMQTKVISTGQMPFVFYQQEAITDKIRPRVLEVGLWVDDELVSDEQTLNCDLDSDNAREREQKIRLVLSKKADAHNGKQIMLKLRQRHRDTTHYEEYASYAFSLRRSFTTDFDDFS